MAKSSVKPCEIKSERGEDHSVCELSSYGCKEVWIILDEIITNYVVEKSEIIEPGTRY